MAGSLNINSILEALGLEGSETPAFKALWASVMSTFGPNDQATLQAALDRQIAGNDAGHEELQEAGDTSTGATDGITSDPAPRKPSRKPQ